MPGYFETNVDCLLLLQGIALLSTAMLCPALARREPVFAWRWLGGAALGEGIGAWMELIGAPGAALPECAVVGQISRAVALACLFGCLHCSGAADRRPVPRAWIVGLVVALAQFSANRADAPEDRWIQAALAAAVTGGAAARLWWTRLPDLSRGATRRLTAASLAGYGLASAWAVLANGFDPGLQAGADPDWARRGFAAELCRALGAVALAAAVYRHRSARADPLPAGQTVG